MGPTCRAPHQERQRRLEVTDAGPGGGRKKVLPPRGRLRSATWCLSSPMIEGRAIHEPWKLDEETRVRLDYPEPVVAL
jgi:hypothetical protein